MTERINGRN